MAAMTEAHQVPKPPTRAATIMGAATLASRGIGFVRIWVVATVLGATLLGNTYQSSSAVSNVLFELLAAGALSAVLVPTFVRHLERDNEAEAERLASGVLGLALGVLGAVAIIGFIAAPQIARLISTGAPTPELRHQQEVLATYLTRFFVFQVLLYAIGTVDHGGPLREAPFRRHRDGPDREHRRGGRRTHRVPHPHRPEPDASQLTDTERLVLALGGMLGVIGFVGRSGRSPSGAPGSNSVPGSVGRTPNSGGC